jgi:hypothetical protein
MRVFTLAVTANALPLPPELATAHVILVALTHKDWLHAVMPMLIVREGSSDAKFEPLTVTVTLPVRAAFDRSTLVSRGASNVNAFVSVPTDRLIVIASTCRMLPVGTEHETDESLVHTVVAHTELPPTAAVPVVSDEPKLKPAIVTDCGSGAAAELIGKRKLSTGESYENEVGSA